MSVVRTTCCYFYTYCTFQLNTYPRYALIGLEHAKTAVSCCHTFTVPFSSTLDALIHWIDIDWIEAKNSDALTMNRIESNRIESSTWQAVSRCHVMSLPSKKRQQQQQQQQQPFRSIVSYVYSTLTPESHLVARPLAVRVRHQEGSHFQHWWYNTCSVQYASILRIESNRIRLELLGMQYIQNASIHILYS
jgi:hypothetical protein